MLTSLDRTEQLDICFTKQTLFCPKQKRLTKIRFASACASVQSQLIWTSQWNENTILFSRQLYWYPKTMKQLPYWYPKPEVELLSYLKLTFIPINVHAG